MACVGCRINLYWIVGIQLIIRIGINSLNQIFPNPGIVDRYYQVEAATSVMTCLKQQKKREAMVVMAPGTGKTRLIVSIVDMLMRTNWINRVLYLVDHIVLVEQTIRVFNQYLPHTSVANTLGSGQIVCATDLTILDQIESAERSLVDNSDEAYFDLIIVDEMYRDHQNYKAIIDYFDSLLLVVSTVPCRFPEERTYPLLSFDHQQPAYEYDLMKAIHDGYVVSPRAISVPHQFQYKSAHTLKQHEGYTNQFDDLTVAAHLNNWLFNKDNINKALVHLMENGLKVEGGNKLGKTLIFALSAQHTELIVNQFKRCFPFLPEAFCCQVDDFNPNTQHVIDSFQLSDQYPQIIVSSGMFDTGVNIPAVLNLVFLKQVNSQEKLWQMIGRGTRLCDHLFGPGMHKKEFLVFDYCQNLESFGVSLQGYTVPRQESVIKRIFNRRLGLILALNKERLKDKSLQVFDKALKDQMHLVIVKLSESSLINLKQCEVVEKFIERENWEYLAGEDIEEISVMLIGSDYVDEDSESVRRFDLLVLDLQTAILEQSNLQAHYQRSLRKIAADLAIESKTPKFVSQTELIRDLQTEDWWQDVTIPILEDVRLTLRDLIKTSGNELSGKFIMSEFGNYLSQKHDEDGAVVQLDPSINHYRLRVERFVREHQNHIVIHRLKNNKPITQTDLDDLEAILFEKEFVISRDIYEQIYGEKPLGVLVRSVVGLSRNAAHQAFSAFLQRTQLDSEQMNFINEIIKFLVRHGVMPLEKMNEKPFIDFHPSGLIGLLGESNAEQIIQLVQAINKNAEVIC